MSIFDEIKQAIAQHPSNTAQSQLGYTPLFCATETSKIVIVGQAPGRKAQESGIVWNDASGQRLISWLGIDEKTFRDPSLIAHIPMDFYYPGKGLSGDLPPRKEFARLWHPQLLSHMPQVKLTLLIGQYAQKYYLNSNGLNLTETVRNYRSYLPKYFPLVHPSPLNFRWLNANTWFEAEVLPDLQKTVAEILK